MKRTFRYRIKSEYSTVEDFLMSQGYSKQNIVDIKKMPKNTFLNGIFVHMNTELKTGDVLEINIQDIKNSDSITAVNLPIDIIYEDEDIIVINKPYAMPIHPSIKHNNNSLANALSYYYKDKEFVFRCTNRLDKDTSGLTVVCKNIVSAAKMSKMIKNKEITREYLALVKGNISSFDLRKGKVVAPISKENDSIKRYVDFEYGEEAITHYYVLDFNNNYNEIDNISISTLINQNIIEENFIDLVDLSKYSLIKLKLETGRTHQIRVHKSYINHPLLGDSLYGGDTIGNLNHQALHSYHMKFKHPITNKSLEFFAPIGDNFNII